MMINKKKKAGIGEESFKVNNFFNENAEIQEMTLKQYFLLKKYLKVLNNYNFN